MTSVDAWDRDDLAKARKALAEGLGRRGAASDERVLDAIREVPRHLFVPKGHRKEAYADKPLRIGEGQTISAPHMVAIMLEAADLGPGQRVLEVGTGSGYHAACTWTLIAPDGRLFTVERHRSLAEEAAANLKAAGFGEGIEVRVGDGTRGLPDAAPFDRVYVTAAAPEVPGPLTEQLSPDGGVLLVPVGDRSHQRLLRVHRTGDGFRREDLGGCAFVPLMGEHGW